MRKFFKKEILESKLYNVLHDPDCIKLNQNECPWDIPIDIKVRITERLIKTDWNRYPVDDLIYLQKKLAKMHGVTPDQIVVSNGSNTLIQALIQIIHHHSKVLILDPTFVIYEMEALLHGNKVIKVPLSENFEMLTEKTLTTIQKEKPGIIFIANPNAPTGTLFDKMSLHRILETAHCPVVIDEAYYPFTKETVIDWLDEFNNLIVMRTFSKAMALAGVRFGYIVADSEVAQQVEKFLMPFRISRITSIIVDEILEDSHFMPECVAKIVKERGRLFSRLQQIENIRVYPSEANFLLLRVRDAKILCQRLMKKGVLVRNVSNGSSLDNHIRITVGTPEENDALIAALTEAAKSEP